MVLTNLDKIQKDRKLARRRMKGTTTAHTNFTTDPESATPVDKALIELGKNFSFDDVHRERLRTLLKNDESLADDLDHLVIAASLMLSDGNEMKSDGLRAYEMGDKIVIEEHEDGTWQTARTIGIGIAVILAHARARKRIEEIEESVTELPDDDDDEVEFDDILEKPIKPDRKPLSEPNIIWSDPSDGTSLHRGSLDSYSLLYDG